MPITANTPSQDGITISRSIQWFMFSPLEKRAIRNSKRRLTPYVGAELLSLPSAM